MLARRGLKGEILALAGRRHLFLRLSGGPPRLILSAHYDRFPGSPGALDNSAACLVLAEAAALLRSRSVGPPPGVILLFTDGEEAPAAGGALSQGAYALGQGLRKTLSGALPAAVGFDVLGRGERFLLSSTPRDFLASEGRSFTTEALPSTASAKSGFARSLETIEAQVRQAAAHAKLYEPLRVPLPWSDDLGFTLAGFPSLTISCLPEEEAAHYALTARPVGSCSERPSPERSAPSRSALGAAWPRTWEQLHGPTDRLELIEPEALDRALALVLALALGSG